MFSDNIEDRLHRKKRFWRALDEFWQEQCPPPEKFPRLAFQPLDLFTLYEAVTSRGGSSALDESETLSYIKFWDEEEYTWTKLWEEVFLTLRFSPLEPVPWRRILLRKLYIQWLLPFENYVSEGFIDLDDRRMEESPIRINFVRCVCGHRHLKDDTEKRCSFCSSRCKSLDLQFTSLQDGFLQCDCCGHWQHLSCAINEDLVPAEAAETVTLDLYICDICREPPFQRKPWTHNVRIEFPQEWNVIRTFRRTGRTAGDYDLYYYTPDVPPKRLRALTEIRSYLYKMKYEFENGPMPVLVPALLAPRGQSPPHIPVAIAAAAYAPPPPSPYYAYNSQQQQQQPFSPPHLPPPPHTGPSTTTTNGYTQPQGTGQQLSGGHFNSPSSSFGPTYALPASERSLPHPYQAPSQPNVVPHGAPPPPPAYNNGFPSDSTTYSQQQQQQQPSTTTPFIPFANPTVAPPSGSTYAHPIDPLSTNPQVNGHPIPLHSHPLQQQQQPPPPPAPQSSWHTPHPPAHNTHPSHRASALDPTLLTTPSSHHTTSLSASDQQQQQQSHTSSTPAATSISSSNIPNGIGLSSRSPSAFLPLAPNGSTMFPPPSSSSSPTLPSPSRHNHNALVLYVPPPPTTTPAHHSTSTPHSGRSSDYLISDAEEDDPGLPTWFHMLWKQLHMDAYDPIAIAQQRQALALENTQQRQSLQLESSPSTSSPSDRNRRSSAPASFQAPSSLSSPPDIQSSYSTNHFASLSPDHSSSPPPDPSPPPPP
eukprot:CAMPEP_0184342806 /NCGR_PEP_ID=MMETSP1089-20130417/11380_1 /TAXON_ID=38269 ORGANISM="Gloeochaete wittrockiana, Strain SAG46.84" /NCGR_SAMPLE_ID=MMETSP1089 /ASSEMBLY_ACC=CAM_ASM_000445 /LENGTH=758 /DNA_ID=CAMNT_0026671823 /DNA_START=105 /DNA_END=2378 /DNA_ORIENTATION=+